MKTVLVGDLHGAVEVVDFVSNLEDIDKVIFIGDYLDSFNRSKEDQVATLKKVLDLIENNPDKYIGLKGNHELSYLYPEMTCSGYSFEVSAKIENDLDRMEKLLKPYVYEQGYLVSHAGVSQKLLNHLDKSLDEYLEEKKFNQIGRARFGFSPCGGLYWCDWVHEFEPVPGVNQIVGHTHYYDEFEFKYIESNDSTNINIDSIPYNNEGAEKGLLLVLNNGVVEKL